MKTKQFSTTVHRWLMTALALMLLLIWSSSQVQAATLTNRSIIIPTALVSATTSHQFRFDYVSNNAVGSVAFEYCSNSPLDNDPCNPPTGLNVANVTFTSQSGQTGFSLNSNTTTNRIVIGRPPLGVLPGAASYTFSNAVNPSTVNQTTFVRIDTYVSNDGTGASIDRGAVAFSLSSGLAVNAFVPPQLTLCAGVTVASDCSSTSGFGIDVGTLSPIRASNGTTQVAAATNDASGYGLFINGTTMTSGNNIILALDNPSISSPGTSQFGINLRTNTSPSAGHEPEGAGTAAPTPGYNQSNIFTFGDGDTIASSATSTDFNRFTITYLVNIPFGQPPGVYSTTLTYTAIASF